jgi:hypothetical protein
MADEDDDVTQGPDNPVDEDGLDLDLTDTGDVDGDDEDADADGAKPAAKQPSVAELQRQLTEANARAARAAAQAVRERRARKAAGVNSKGKSIAANGAETAAASATSADPLADLSPELRKLVLDAQASRDAAQEQLAQAQAASKQRTVEAGLREAGLKLPADADAARIAMKKVLRLIEMDDIEIDADGDLLGLDEQISLVQDALPGLFAADTGDAAAVAAERAAANGNGAATKKPRINPGAGGRTPAAGGPKTYASTAEYLLSKEYGQRNQARSG